MRCFQNFQGRRSTNNLLILLSITLFISCSHLSRRTKDATTNNTNATVPAEQYQQLLEKYNSLLRQTGATESGANLEQKENDTSSTVVDVTQKDKYDLIDQLNQQVTGTELAETVDVFAEEKKSKLAVENQNIEESVDVIEKQIVTLQQAEELIAGNQLSKALSLLKEGPEKSNTLQIRTRAKFLLGEILFKQNEFDLAMQVYEEIITSHAFSGTVLKAIGRIIVCCEKLKLEKKKTKYYSILHDFFES